MRGRYIVLEGGEGSGKDEQQKRLITYLKDQGIKAVAAREPGTTDFSEVARKEMLSRFKTSAITQLLIVNAARSDTIEHVSELLEKGVWVVCTRNWLSSYALQGHGMGLDIKDVEKICAFSTQGVEPDLTIILDVSVEEAEERRKARGGPDDNYNHRYEEEDRKFHEKVRQGYLEAANKFNYPMVDAAGTRDQVAKRIKELVEKMQEKPEKPTYRLTNDTPKEGVYSNRQIKQAIEEGHIVCVPYNPKHVSHASLDVTLGRYFYRTERSGDKTVYNPFNKNDVSRYFGDVQEAIPHGVWARENGIALVEGIPEDHPIIPLKPGERILAHTHEFFGIKPPGAYEVKSRSSWGRNGVAVCFDAGWVDPGYINRLTLEIYNLNSHETVLLPIGERIAQAVFVSTGDVEGNYGLGRDDGISGKYQSGTDLDTLIKTWEPSQMLPKSYMDSRILPKNIEGLRYEAHLYDETAENKTSKPITMPTAVGDILKQQTQNHEPLVAKNEHGNLEVTQAGKAFLSDAVTDVDGDVYAFGNKLSNATVAAAMARLSRRGDDMRITILDEFVDKEGKDEDLLQRVITAYGDDSVQQLAGIHFVVENASNLLTKKLEWGRLAAYLEQSTRYIYFDQKDSKGNYKYYTPSNLDADTARTYEKTMDKIFDTYSTMVRELTGYVRKQSNVSKKERDMAWKGATRAQACDAVRPVLPVATKSTVGIYASAQAAESLYMHLMSDELEESRTTGKALIKQLRETVPVFFERADKPDRGGAAIAYRANTRSAVQKIAETKLPQNLSPEANDVQLLDYWPKNELELIPHMLFEHSSLPIEQIDGEVSTWSYDDKVKTFRTYMGERLNRRHKPGRALEIAHYTWELVCDYGIFRDLQRHRIVDDLEWQHLSPRYGYEVPQLVEEAGLSDLFEKCFDMSYELYSSMQAAGYENEAQYATLLGHRMRWKITYNAREAFHLHELRTAPQGHPGYRKLVKKMHDTLANVHPIIADSMIFVNKDEDPALTRLAAEKYTQYKLQELDSKKKK